MDAISLAISRSGGSSLNAHRRWFPAKRALLSVPAARGPSFVWKLQQQRSYLCSLCHNYTVPCHRLPASTNTQIHSDDSNRCDIIDIKILTVIFSTYYTILFYIQQFDTRKLNFLSETIRGFKRTTTRCLWSLNRDQVRNEKLK